MKDILAEIVKHKRDEIGQSQGRVTLADLERTIAGGSITKRQFHSSLAKKNVSLIAEVKRQSPSAGALKIDLDLNSVIALYDRYAQAISVVTDEKYFGGNLQMIAQIKRLSSLPVLCKDFIVSPYQIYQAKAAGADALLLIAKIVDAAELSQLHEKCLELGLEPVVEIQNDEELSAALGAGATTVLINNRDLRSFEIDFATTRLLAPKLAPGTLCICASGIGSREDINALLPYASCFLVGSSLMKAPDLELKLKELSGVSACAP
jgi:indole-3-glycerol phosphate synthase